MKQYTLIVLGLLLLVGCTDDRYSVQNGKVIPKENFFDFSLTQNIRLDLDYCLTDYRVLFELYDEFPLVTREDGSVVKKDITPLYRATTDQNGRYSGEIVLPSMLDSVWLASDYIGTIAPVRLAIIGRKVEFNQHNFIESLKAGVSTRAKASNGYTYPDNCLILGTWGALGKPDYLLPELATPPATILYNIKDTYRVANDYKITQNHKDYFGENVAADVVVTKPTKVNLVFLNSGAAWTNAVGYYTYPTGKTPTSVSEIQRIIAFPHAAPIYYNGKIKGSLVCGDQVQLKYWDGEKFQDEFPAGVSIGWFLIGNGFSNGNIGKGLFENRFSTRALNTDGLQRCVSLKDRDTDQIVAIGFEDNNNMDYCDATFYLDIEQKGAIDSSQLPSLPDTGAPTDNENYTDYFGTLAFEDQWPAKGDYDMNDVMVDYTSRVYKNILGDKVYKIVEEYSVRNNDGGVFDTGFGIQLNNLSAVDIRNITINDKPYVLEEGQTYPTIILFNNVKQVRGKKFVVTIELNDVEVKNVTPPYNPFIISKTDEGRGREIHLVNYRPTDKADVSLFGTLMDVSRPEEGLYYVSKDMMPYAIHLPRIKDFPTPDENIGIDKAYSEFTKWAQSFGTQYKDWYKKKTQ